MSVLLNPAPNRPITSGFGPRTHPITGAQSTHYGLDFGGSFPVQAAEDGVVEKVGYSRTGYGHYVIIRHTSTLKTLYAHGAHRTHYVEGQFIKAGAIIFQSGTTGLSTGNHLHFEVRVRKNLIWHRVDPMPYITDAPKKRRKGGRVVALYHKKVGSKTTFALAGDSPGTSANWLETQDQSLANGWAAQVGNSVELSPATFESFKTRYLQPLAVAAGASASAQPAKKTYVGTLELKEQ